MTHRTNQNRFTSIQRALNVGLFFVICLYIFTARYLIIYFNDHFHMSPTFSRSPLWAFLLVGPLYLISCGIVYTVAMLAINWCFRYNRKSLITSLTVVIVFSASHTVFLSYVIYILNSRPPFPNL
jgi:hypothetical protein